MSEASVDLEQVLYGGITDPVDDSSAVDALEDPLREISEKFYSTGDVITGTGEENGAYVRFGGYRLPNILAPGAMCTGPVYGVVSYEAHRQLYTNPATSSSLFEGSVEPFFGRTLSPRDAPEHTKFRNVMQRGFMPKQIESYKDTIARPVLNRRFSAIKANGKADLVRELNVFYPYEIVGSIVGYGTTDLEFLAGCMDGIWQANRDINRALEAGQKLQDFALALIEKRRKEPKDDFVSAMLEAEVDGQKISDADMIGLVNHLFSGGIETTSRQTNVLVFDLLSHPDQLGLLRSNRELIRAAVEENLRYNGIGGSTCRVVKEAIEICGTAIPEDAVVFTFHDVASRDPARWENPHTFDITRPVQKHFTFAMGPHMCIGQHLARFLLAVYLEHFLDDLPNVRWDSDATIPKVTGWNQRSCSSLPVIWDV